MVVVSAHQVFDSVFAARPEDQLFKAAFSLFPVWSTFCHGSHSVFFRFFGQRRKKIRPRCERADPRGASVRILKLDPWGLKSGLDLSGTPGNRSNLGLSSGPSADSSLRLVRFSFGSWSSTESRSEMRTLLSAVAEGPREDYFKDTKRVALSPGWSESQQIDRATVEHRNCVLLVVLLRGSSF